MAGGAVQGDHGGQRLGFDDFDLFATMSALFCLGSCKLSRNGIAVSYHHGLVTICCFALFVINSLVEQRPEAPVASDVGVPTRHERGSALAADGVGHVGLLESDGARAPCEGIWRETFNSSSEDVSFFGLSFYRARQKSFCDRFREWTVH